MPDAPQLTLIYSSALTPAAMVYSLDGNASVSQASVADFPVNAATISLWLKTNPGQIGGIVFSYDSASSASRLWIRNPENIEVLFAGASTGLTGIAVNDGSWHQLVVTIAPSDPTHFEVGIYLDGVSSFYGVGAITRAVGAVLRTDGALVLGKGITGETGFTGQMSEFRLLSGIQSAPAVMTTLQTRWTAASVIYWALTSAQTSGTIQGGSFVQSTLVFRTQSLIASWTQVAGATSYDLEVTGPDGFAYSPTNLPWAPVSIPGFSLNANYSGRVRAVVGGVPGDWSAFATVLTLDLQQVQPVFAASGTTLTASWTAIDQAQSYDVANYQDGAATPAVTNQAATTYDLSAKAQSNSSWKTTFSASSMNSLGPPSSAVTLQPVAVVFRYYGNQPTPYLEASWDLQPNASWFFVQITDTTSGAQIVNTIVPGTQSSSRITNYVVGDTYSARVRPIGAGMIGAWTAAPNVTVANLVAPLITALVGDGTAHTLRVDWSYSTACPPDGPFFNVELWRSDGSTPLQVKRVQGLSTTFNDPAVIVNGAQLKVRIDAECAGSLGLWSGFSAITIGAPAQVQGVAASANDAKDVTVNWTAVGGSGVTYTARIFGPGGVDTTQNNITGTTWTFPSSLTNVQVNETYNISVAAVQNSLTGPPGTTTVKIAPSQGPGWVAYLVDPVDVASGAYVYANVLLATDGVVPLVFSVHYVSTTPAAGESPYYDGHPLGNRWNHVYNTRIAWNAARTQVQVLWGTGSVILFNAPSSVTGTYAPAGLTDGNSLFLGTDMVFVLRTRRQEVYRFTFDGRLFDIETTAGNHAVLTYENNVLKSVADPQGQTLQFTYDSGNLKTVTSGPRSVSFDYQSGNLQKITDSLGGSIAFTYTGLSLVEMITAQNNSVVCKNSYYTSGANNGRMKFQQDGRAVAAGAAYGTSFDYQFVTENGIDIVVTSVVDREGNSMEFRSVKANSNILRARYPLPDGRLRVIKRTYDGFANILTSTFYEGPAADWTDGKGNTTVYTYDGNGNMLTATDPAGRVTTYTWDGANNMTSLTDADGNKTVWHFEGNLIRTITPPVGPDLTFDYWPGALKGLLKTYTDAQQNSFQYEYTNGFLTLGTNPLGEKTVMEWTDGRPRVVDIRDAAGVSVKRTTIDYWAPGWIKRTAVQFAGQSEAAAFATSYDYDGVGNLKTLDDPSGNRFTNEYNENNYLKKTNFPPFGGQTRHTDYEYNRIDQLLKSTYSPQVSTQSTWNDVGERLTSTDANTNVYRYGLGLQNTAGQAPYNWEQIATFPLLTGDPVAYTESSVFNASTRLIAMKDRGGRITDIGYSRQQNTPAATYDTLTTVTLPPAKTGDPRLTVVLRYDPLGRIIRLTNTALKQTTYAYSSERDSVTNSNLLVVTITDPAGRERLLKYDAMGRLVYSRRGPAASGVILQYSHDAIGRLTHSRQQKNASTIVDTAYTYAYDSTLQLLAVTIGRPGGAPTHTQYYDGNGRLRRDTDALGRSELMTLTPWGAIATFTNRRGKTFTYGFDLAGRLVTTTLPDNGGVITQTLDGNGNRTQTQRAAAPPIVRTFDQWNRMKTRTDAASRLVSYAWWPTNPLKRLTYPDVTKSVDYEIDNLDRLTKVTDWSTRATNYDYWPSGMLKTASFWNGVTGSYTYDDADNLTGVVHSRSTILVAKETVVLDPTGVPATGQSVLAIAPTLTGAGSTFTYNGVNEISTWNSQQATYDDDGNLLSLLDGSQPRTAVYDQLNRLTAAGTDVYTYDDDGFRSGSTVGGAQKSFVYDAASWQSPQVERADPYRAVVAYAQWPSAYGLNSGAPRYGDERRLIPAPEATDRLIEIRDGEGAVTSRFVHGSLGLVSMENAAGEAFVFHGNAVGNTLALTDSAGEISDRYAYDAFGKLAAAYGPSTQPFRYNGRSGVFDDGNGILYMRARSYSPSAMGFLQRDPLIGNIDFPQTLNGYSFVAGDPLRYEDPLGLALVITAAVVGVTAVAVAIAAAIFGGGSTTTVATTAAIPMTVIPSTGASFGSSVTPPRGYTEVGQNEFEGPEGNTVRYRGGRSGGGSNSSSSVNASRSTNVGRSSGGRGTGSRATDNRGVYRNVPTEEFSDSDIELQEFTSESTDEIVDVGLYEPYD